MRQPSVDSRRELAFAGESSSRQLGLDPLFTDDVSGDFYVTAEPVHDSPADRRPMRQYCVRVAEKNSFLSGGPVPDNWSPPRQP